MSQHFNPPSGDALASVDVANCEYQNKLVEVQGVIAPSGQAGSLRDESYSVHLFCFSAWRLVGQPLRRTKLTLLRPVPTDAEYFGELPKGTLYRFEVLLSVDESRAIISRHLEANIADVDLAAVAQEDREPVIVHTQHFGDLTLNRTIQWFEGATHWNGVGVEITFMPKDGLDSDGSFTSWYGDDDIFAGHSIEVCGTLEKGLTSSDMAG